MDLSKIREQYTELVDFLKEIMFQKEILERPSYMELSKKLGFTYNWIKDKKDTLKAHTPQKRTFDDLYNRLTERYKDALNDSWNNIEDYFRNLYNVSFPTVPDLPSTAVSNNSIKRKFFDDIKDIIKKHFPESRVFDTDISRIFFRRARALKESHIKGNTKFRRLELSTLFGMVFKIRNLSIEDLVKKIRDIKKVNQVTLINMKNEIEVYIEDFIFSNPFESNYISEKHDAGTLYFKPEYDLTFYIWMNLSQYRDTPILLKHVRNILKYETFGRLNKGWEYSWDGLMNMLKQLITLLPGEVYSRVFEQVSQYIELRNLYLPLPRIYHRSWYAFNTIKFHIVMLIIRDLGLDILNLEEIDPEAFQKTKTLESFTYERHHIYINDKLTLDVNRLALVMHKNHNDLEGKTDLVLDLIRSRVDLNLECPQYYKENVRNWEHKWQIYLERRNYLIENGIERFIRKYFTDENGNNYLIIRFFKNTKKGKIHQEIKLMMQDWIEKNRPAPILNTYVLKRLFFGTPKLLTSGFIENKS